MQITLVWMLISLSVGSNNQGNAQTIGYFPKQYECQKVADAIQITGSHSIVRTVCIQAETVIK